MDIKEERERVIDSFVNLFAIWERGKVTCLATLSADFTYGGGGCYFS